MSFQDRFFGPNRSKTYKIWSCVVIALIFLKFAHHYWNNVAERQSDQSTTSSEQADTNQTDSSSPSADAPTPQSQSTNIFQYRNSSNNYMARVQDGFIIITGGFRSCGGHLQNSINPSEAAIVNVGKLDENMKFTDTGCGYIQESDPDHINIRWTNQGDDFAPYDLSDFSQIDLQKMNLSPEKLSLQGSFEFIAGDDIGQ